VEAGGLQVKASSYKVSKILSQKQNKNKRAWGVAQEVEALA
jgi:hypothetical protein